MATLTLKDGRVFEGTIEELAELAKKLDESNPEGFRRVEGREPRVGDYVKFFEDGYDITAGKYYEIINFDDDGDPEFIDDGGDVRFEFLIYLGKRFELFEKVGGEKPLKVGDYVVPLESADDEYNITNTEMKLGKVVKELEEDYRDIKVEVIAHENDLSVGVIFPVESKYFRKATDEEVAQAKAEYERKQSEQKWAKIGRKPGEFKVGDIVEYDGTLDEIKGVKEPGYICGEEGVTLVKGGWRFAFNIKLVAPVESRLDKEA